MAAPNININNWGSQFFGYSYPHPNFIMIPVQSMPGQKSIQDSDPKLSDTNAHSDANAYNETSILTEEAPVPYRAELDPTRISEIAKVSNSFKFSIDHIVIDEYHGEFAPALGAMEEVVALNAVVIDEEDNNENFLSQDASEFFSDTPDFSEISENEESFISEQGEKPNSADEKSNRSYDPNSDYQDQSRDYLMEEYDYEIKKQPPSLSTRRRIPIVKSSRKKGTKTSENKNPRGKKIPLETVLKTADFLKTQMPIRLPESQWKKQFAVEAKKEGVEILDGTTMKRILGHVLICPNQSEQMKTRVEKVSSHLFLSITNVNPSCDLCSKKSKATANSVNKKALPVIQSTLRDIDSDDEMSDSMVHSSDISMSNQSHPSKSDDEYMDIEDFNIDPDDFQLDLSDVSPKSKLTSPIHIQKKMPKTAHPLNPNSNRKKILTTPIKTANHISKTKLRQLNAKEFSGSSDKVSHLSRQRDAFGRFKKDK